MKSLICQLIGHNDTGVIVPHPWDVDDVTELHRERFDEHVEYVCRRCGRFRWSTLWMRHC